MNDIQVGDRVRFLANSYVDGYQYEPTDPSKKLVHLRISCSSVHNFESEIL